MKYHVILQKKFLTWQIEDFSSISLWFRAGVFNLRPETWNLVALDDNFINYTPWTTDLQKSFLHVKKLFFVVLLLFIGVLFVMQVAALPRFQTL